MKRADAEILTVDDLAELFACDKETAATRLTSGDLPGVKVGRGWVIPRQALFERLNEKAREEAAARREQQASILNAAQYRRKSLHSDPAKSKTLSDLAIASVVVTPRGRRRREPPELPSMANYLNK